MVKDKQCKNANSSIHNKKLALKTPYFLITDGEEYVKILIARKFEGFSTESSIIRYAKIAMQLQNKTVRDVALRCRWMNKKENSKRRKEEHNLSRKSKDKKERVTDPSAKSSQYAARSNVPPYAPPMIPMDNDDGISFKEIGGDIGDLLEQNSDFLNQISVNIAGYQLQENVNLFCQTRSNIINIMNGLRDLPDVMKQMPPLPVKLNEDLANTILPRTSHPMQL